MAINASHIFERLYMHFSLPIVMKEMRVRMRGVRLPLLLFTANALAMMVGFIILGLQPVNLVGGNNEADYATLGRNLMLGLMVLEMLLCTLITPALTATAFSTECEQQTLELLLLTPLSSSNIVFAKLISAIGFIALMLMSVVPVAALSFMFGGVSPWQFLLALLLLLDMTVCFSAIGLLCSIRFLKTSVAYTVAYSVCLAWLVLLPFIGGLLQQYFWQHSTYVSVNILSTLMFAGVLMVLATVPAVFTSMIIRLIRGRPASRSTNLIVWGVFASGACLLLSFPNAQDIMNTNYLVFANPVAALVIILGGAADLPFPAVDRLAQNSMAFQISYVTAAIGLLALGAWGAFKLTEREVERLRRPQVVGT